MAIAPGLRQVDLRGAAETVACGAVLQNRTLFRGVSLLPCAAQWSFDTNGRVDRRSYFTPEAWERQPKLDHGAFYESLYETFRSLLPKYFGGTREVAMSLTGGLDGRMIMAYANRPPGTLKCYTFGGPYRDCADVLIARRIAAICAQPHRTIRVTAEFLENFSDFAEKTVFVSDGAMDVSGAVELYVNRAAKEIAPVRLTGNYGSEVIRGNVAFRPARLAQGLFDPEFAQMVRDAEEAYREERNVSLLSFIAFKQTPWYHYARLAVEQSQLTLRSPYLDNALVALMYRAPPELLVSKEPSLRLIYEGNPAIGRIPTDRGEVYGDDSLVGKLRVQIAEFTAKAEYAYDYGMPRPLARIDCALAPLHLERLFLGRHKFYHFRVWYRDQLSRYVKDVLLDPRSLSRAYVERSSLERIVKEHTDGSNNWTREIHRMLDSRVAAKATDRAMIETARKVNTKDDDFGMHPIVLPRNLALDLVKGELVVVMAIYHAMNLFTSAGPNELAYVRFVSGSFVLLSGFICARSYETPLKSHWRNTSRVLVLRGLKLLALFTVLNLLINLTGVGNPTKGPLGLHQYWDRLFEIYVQGQPTFASFQILLPIGYIFIAAPIVLRLGKFGIPLFVLSLLMTIAPRLLAV